MIVDYAQLIYRGTDMKRIIALLLVLIISVSLCACGKKKDQGSMTMGQVPQNSEQIDFSSVVTVVSSPAPIATEAPVFTPEPTQAPIYTPEPTQAPAYSPEATQVPIYTPIPSAPITNGIPTPVNTGYVKITKSPTSETVSVGGKAIFTAYGENYTKIEWLTASPGTTNRTVYIIDDAPAHFTGLIVSGQGTNVLTLDNIPAEMNGWEIQAKFIGANDTKWSDDAYITISGVGTATSGGVTANTDIEKLVLAQAKACLDGISTYGRTLGYSVGGFENYTYNNGKADFNVTVTGSQYIIIGEFIATDSTYYPIYANAFGPSSMSATPLTFQQCSMTDFYTVLSSPQNYIK